jgi:hypothetical protein
MDHFDELHRELRNQRQLLEELLKAASQPGAGPVAKNVLALLSQSLDTIRQNRNAWLRLDPQEKEGRREITELLRDNQNLITRILVLDKENGQSRPPGTPVRQSPPETAESSGSPLLSRIYRRGSAT